MAIHRVTSSVELANTIRVLGDGDEVHILNRIDIPNSNPSADQSLLNLTIKANGVIFRGVGDRQRLVANAIHWTGRDSLDQPVSDNTNLFVIKSSGVRFENLQIEGGYYLQDRLDNSLYERCGIRVAISGSDPGYSCEVVSCSMLGWPHSAIRIGRNSSARIRCCHLHKCRAEGAGYLVSVYGGTAHVNRCVLSRFRHAITANARDRSSYFASDNIVVASDWYQQPGESPQVRTAFDVHGTHKLDGWSKPDPNTALYPPLDQGSDYSDDPDLKGGDAGAEYEITDNTILNASGKYGYFAQVRGEPLGYFIFARNRIFSPPGIGFTGKFPKRADHRKFHWLDNEMLSAVPLINVQDDDGETV